MELEHTIIGLHDHLDEKRVEIVGMERDLRDVKRALEERDKAHALMLQKYEVQSSIRASKETGRVEMKSEVLFHIS